MFFYILLLYPFCITRGSSDSLNFQEAGVPSQFYIDDGYFEAYGAGDNKGETDLDISSSAVRGEGLTMIPDFFFLTGFHGFRAIF